MALRTYSEMSVFMKNHKNQQKSPIFIQNDSESLVLSDFDLEINSESHPIATAFKTCSAMADFMKNRQKSPIFIQNDPRLLVSGHFNRGIITESLPTSYKLLRQLNQKKNRTTVQSSLVLVFFRSYGPDL